MPGFLLVRSSPSRKKFREGEFFWRLSVMMADMDTVTESTRTKYLCRSRLPGLSTKPWPDRKTPERLLFRLIRISCVIACLLCVTLARASDPSGYSKAEALIRQGEWDKGIVLLQPILRVDPRNPKVRNLMGIALTGKGELAKADEQFREAVRIDPRFFPALKNLAVNEFTLKDVAASEKDFITALKMAPDDPVIHTYLGEIAYGRHDYRRAASSLAKGGQLVLRRPDFALHLVDSYLLTGQEARALELLSEMNPAGLDPRAQYQTGLLLGQHNLFQQAIPYFQAVRERFPDSYDTSYNLALCEVEAKQYSRAIDMLEDLARRGHKTAELDNLLGFAYEGNHETPKALETLREATLLAPNDEKNYLDFAVLCFDHDFYQLGLDAVNVGLHYLPQSDPLTFQRGVLNALLGHFEAAERDFETAAKLAPERDLAYVGLGMTYLQSAHPPEALRVLRARVKTAHGRNDPMVLYLLGEALIRSGVSPGHPDFPEAQEALEKSVKLQPRYSRSHIDLAKLYLMESRLDEAISHLEKARELDPKNTSVYSHLAVAYRRKGNREQAKSMAAIMAKLNAEDRAHVYPVSKLMKQGSAQDPALQKSPGEAEKESKPARTPQALPPPR